MKKNLTKDVKAARKSLGINGDSQQELLKMVREVYGLSNEELAKALEISLNTLLAYLSPDGTAKFRRMPEADKLVLCKVLAKRRSK